MRTPRNERCIQAKRNMYRYIYIHSYATGTSVRFLLNLSTNNIYDNRSLVEACPDFLRIVFSCLYAPHDALLATTVDRFTIDLVDRVNAKPHCHQIIHIYTYMYACTQL